MGLPQEVQHEAHGSTQQKVNIWKCAFFACLVYLIYDSGYVSMSGSSEATVTASAETNSLDASIGESSVLIPQEKGILAEAYFKIHGRQLESLKETRQLSGTAVDSTASDSSNSNETHTSGHASAHNSSHAHQQDALFFLFNALVIGTIVLHLTTLPRFHSLQQTVALFGLGVVYSLIQEGLDLKQYMGVFGHSYEMWMAIDPHLLLFTMLPALLAGDAMTVNTTVARSVAQQCIFLAGPGVIFGSFLTAAFLYALMPNWPFMLCLTTGSILAATDPVAVVGLLKELGASPTLTVQIQGESLLNDGTAIVLYSVAYDILSEREDYDASGIMVFLVIKAGCAVGLGLVIGYLFYLWIKLACDRLNHHAGLIQTSLTLCCAYWSFCIAEGFLKISGVLCTVAAAMVLADKMWPVIVDRHSLLHIWHMFEYLGNTVIFFLAGALTGNTMVHILLVDYLRLFAIYIACMAIRAMLLFGCRPMLTHLSVDFEPVSKADVAVMTWGGLRGAVGLALAIEVNISKADGNISDQDARRVLFYVGGVASLTLCINATTCPMLVRRLGVTKTSMGKQRMLYKIFNQLRPLMMQQKPTAPVEASVTAVLNDAKHHIEHLCKASADNMDDLMSHEAMKKRRKANRALRRAIDVRENLHGAKGAYEKKVTEQHIAILDCPPFPFCDQQDAMQKIIAEQECDPGIMKAVHTSFLTLVENEYWQQLRAGDFLGGVADAEMLLTTTSLGIKHAGSHLCDLKFLLYNLHESHKDAGLNGDSLGQVIEEEEALEGKRRPGSFVTGLRNDFTNSAIGTMMFSRSTEVRMARQTSSQKARQCCNKEFWGWRRGKKGEEETWLMKKVDSAISHTFMVVVLLLNALFILIEQTTRNDDNYHYDVWIVMETIFISIFTIEFILKFIALRCGYFKQGWNWFDFAIVALSYVGVGMELAANDSGAQSDVSKEARIFRLNRVFRVLRILRLVRLMRFFKILANAVQSKDISLRLGEHMRTITAFRAFVQAHINSQIHLASLFATEGKVETCEEARCILESQTEVYKALYVAALETENVEAENVVFMRMLRENIKLTRKATDFVLGAHESGVITAREAETIAHPLQDHVRIFQDGIQRTVRGSLHSASGVESHGLGCDRSMVAADFLSPTKSTAPRNNCLMPPGGASGGLAASKAMPEARRVEIVQAGDQAVTVQVSSSNSEFPMYESEHQARNSEFPMCGDVPHDSRDSEFPMYGGSRDSEHQPRQPASTDSCPRVAAESGHNTNPSGHSVEGVEEVSTTLPGSTS